MVTKCPVWRRWPCREYIMFYGQYSLDSQDRTSYSSSTRKQYLKIIEITERRSKMNHLKVIILIAAVVLFFTSLTATSYAEQRTIAPKQIQKSVPAFTTQAPATSTPAIKPLQQSLLLQGSLPPLICPATVNTINDVIKLAQTDVPQAVQAYTNQGSVDFPGTSENVAGVYRNYVQDCCSPNKSFTVQDQKNAGCTNSDNVSLCMEKVIKHCISQYPQRNSLKGMLFQSLQKSNKISVKTKQLQDKISQLHDMIP